MPQPLIDRVEAWASANGATRSEAFRHLVELGLKAKAEISVLTPGSRAASVPDPVQAAADRAAARSKERKP